MKTNDLLAKANPRQQNGVALLAVLWLVAALSLMLSGLQQVIRGEIRMSTQARTGVINNGLADAAIRLTLQQLIVDKNKPVKSIQTKKITVFGKDVTIELIPLNGFIDINNAAVTLLADAFEFGGGAPKEVAQRLAESAIEVRDRKGNDGAPMRFHATEDLLRIAGLDYDVYARLKILLTADIIGSGRVNPLAASQDTLLILSKGDPTRAQQLFESRRSNPESMDTTTLTAAHIEIAPSQYLLIRATTTTPDNIRLSRDWRVDVTTSTYGLPWRVISVDQTTATELRPAK